MSAKAPDASAKLLFLRQFLRHPRMVGSVIPTSRSAVRALLRPVDWSTVRCAVEYGPGTGVFTRALLERLEPGARLVAIDPNPLFITHLRRTITDERLICVEGSAADVEQILADRGIDAADRIISGLPFSTLPPALADEIVAATRRALRPGGAFLVYQYSLFLLPLLRRHFEHVTRALVWRCVPPARLFWATRLAAAADLISGGESLAAE
jgi:phospholipid N-methyltransferase